MYYEKLKNLCRKVVAVNEGELIKDTFSDTSVKFEIIQANQKQLYEQGVDSKGASTGGYAARTKEYKETVAGPLGRDTRNDHITLKDSGDMYNSMEVEATTDGPKISADMNKEGNDLEKQWPDALGLTDESIADILPTVKTTFIGTLRQAIFG